VRRVPAKGSRASPLVPLRSPYTKRSFDAFGGQPPHELHAVALVEAHYYLSTWQGARRALEALRENGFRLETPRQVWRKYAKRFESYTKARDHLEHYDVRLPGRKKTAWAQIDANSISGTMPVLASGPFFCFQGKTWAVDGVSAAMLQGLFDELITGLRAEIKARLVKAQAEERTAQ